jgi:uncharacterized membrane protein
MAEQIEPLTRPVKILAGIFTISGLLHFLAPRPYISIVPKKLPRKREIVYLSGLWELACAFGLIKRKQWAGPASTALLLGVWPANVDMAIKAKAQGRPKWFRTGLWVRVPLQIPLLAISVSAGK